MIFKKPNILLIVLDAARADHFSCYGYYRNTTPNIDKIASEGILYENTTSTSCWTLESIASIFTGFLPSKHKANWSTLKLKESIFTLPEYLKENGYVTFCISNNEAFFSRKNGLAKGFDYFKEVKFLFSPEEANSKIKIFLNVAYEKIFYTRYKFDIANYGKGNFWKTLYKKILLGRYHIGATETNFRFKNFVKKIKSNNYPFFALLHYIDPHLPYRPPGRFEKLFTTQYAPQEIKKVNHDALKFLSGQIKMSERDFEILKALYDGELAYVDNKVGEIYNFLKKEKILDNTILIITSDHGENIGDHGLMDHRYCLYESVLKVPLIIRYPEVFKPQTRITSLTQNFDIFPTLEEIIGKKSGFKFDAISLFEREKKSEETNSVFAEYLVPEPVKDEKIRKLMSKYFYSIKAIRKGKYKLIWKSNGEKELYNLVDDPTENKNIFFQFPQLTENLLNELIAKTGEFNSKFVEGFKNKKYEEEEIKNRLKNLGYL